MKSIFVDSLHTFVVALFLTPLLIQAEDQGTTVSVSNLFSYQAPPGWVVQKPEGSKYPAASDIKNGGVNGGMIAVEVDTKPDPLEEWCKESLAKNMAQWSDYNPRGGDLTPFETTTGAKGFRSVLKITVEGKDIHWAIYLFAGSSNAKIAVSCTSPAELADRYAPIFDAAMKTFVAH